MSVNRCVVCGKELPEGTMLCKEHLVSIPINLDDVKPYICIIDDIAEFNVEHSATLLENLVKYYIYDINMNPSTGTLRYDFIVKHMKPCDCRHVDMARGRLMEDFIKTKETIERMIVPK